MPRKLKVPDASVKEWYTGPLFLGFRWPVWRVEIGNPPPPPVAALLGGPDRVPPHGVFVPAAALRWERGADLIPGELHRYNPLEKAQELLLSVMEVHPENAEDLTAFVNRWGQLGIGAWPGDLPRGFDSVYMTGQTLGAVRRLARWLGAMRRGDWSSDALPGLEEARRLAAGLVGGIPDSLSVRDRPRLFWLAFDGALRPHIRGRVWPRIRWEHRTGQPVLAFTAERLVDVLYLTLVDMATSGRSLRQCRHRNCGDFFLADRANQIYCSRRCASHAAVDQYREKERQHRQRQRRRRRVKEC